jgi:hypothetical protein
MLQNNRHAMILLVTFDFDPCSQKQKLHTACFSKTPVPKYLRLHSPRLLLLSERRAPADGSTTVGYIQVLGYRNGRRARHRDTRISPIRLVRKQADYVLNPNLSANCCGIKTPMVQDRAAQLNDDAQVRDR